MMLASSKFSQRLYTIVHKLAPSIWQLCVMHPIIVYIPVVPHEAVPEVSKGNLRIYNCVYIKHWYISVTCTAGVITVMAENQAEKAVRAMLM